MAGNYVSTGGAVADELQRILTSRKAEARQAMLDEIFKQKSAADIAATTENTASQKLYREAQAEYMRSQAQEKLGNSLNAHQDLDPSTVARLDPSQVDPAVDPERSAIVGPQGFEVIPQTSETYQGAEGQFNDPGAAQNTSGVESLFTKTAKTHPAQFHGSPEQLELERQHQSMGKTLSMPREQLEGMDDLQRLMLFRSFDPKGTVPAEVFKSEKPEFMFDQVTGKYTKAVDENGNPVPPGSHTTIRTRPPQPTAANAPSPIYFIDPRNQTAEPAKDENGKPIILPPHTKTAVVPQVPVQSPQLRQALGQLATLKRPTGANARPADPQVVAQAEKNVVLAFGMDPDLQQVVFQILSIPGERQKPIEQIIANIEQGSQDPLTDEDKQQIAEIISTLKQ